MAIQITALIILLLLSGFFSSAETALTTVNSIQIQILAEEGSKSAKKVQWITENSAKMLSTILIGNNIVNISASALATTLTIRAFGDAYVGAATGILTILVLMFGEITPKSLAKIYSLQLSLAYAAVVCFLMKVLTPLVFIVDLLRKGLLKLLRIDPNAKTSTITEEELKTLVDVGHEEGAIENDEFTMITNVFDLDDTLAKDIMVPRIDMTFLQADMSYQEVMEIYKQDHYTRYPVYVDSKDSIIGTINIKDFLTLENTDNFNLRDFLREPHFTFEHKEVGTLLIEMRSESISFVIVLNEYGSTSGMITLEDILEEIVGEIRDEYDKDEKDPIIETKNKNTYLIDGSTNLDDVNEALNLKLVSEEYDSLGGFLIETLDRLPKSGETVTLPDGTKLIAEVVRRNRVEKVLVIKKGM